MTFVPYPSVKEVHEIWVSYAGNDEDSVEGISDNISRGQEHLLKNGCDLSSYQHLKAVHLVPQKYKLLDKTKASGEPVYHYRLKGGDHISELSIDIASSLLKVVVLSKSYFKSPACLEELCLCLCSNHCESNVYPLVIIAEPEDKNIFSDNYTFQIPKTPNEALSNGTSLSSESITTTLADAMERTLRYLSKRYSTLPGFNLKPKSLQDFEKIIGDLSNCVFSKVPKEGNQKEYESIAKEIYRFALKTIDKSRKKDHLAFISQEFHSIISKEIVKPLIAKTSDKDIEQSFIDIKDTKDARDFVELLGELIKENHYKEPSHLKKYKIDLRNLLQQLCCLAFLKLQNSIAASLLPYFSQIESIIPYNCFDTENSLADKFHVGIIYSIAYKKPFHLMSHETYDSIESAPLSGFINADYRAYSPNDSSTDDITSVARNIIHNCNPNDIFRLEKSDVLEAKNTLKKIERDLNKKHSHGQIKALLLKEENRNRRGSHSVVENFRQYLETLGYEERIKIPMLEMKQKRETIQKGHKEHLIDDDYYLEIKECFNDIFTLIESLINKES